MNSPARLTATRRWLAPCALLTPLLLPCLSAQVTPETPASDEIVQLSAFTISADSADRYRAVDAISGVRVRAPLLDTASSISVVTRDMIDDLAPSRIFDVVRYVAGIQDGRGLQFQDRMIIRGFEANGQRTVDNFLQPSDADNIDEAVIERLEITKGPNAILSPAGAPGGSINVITKSPLYRQHGSVTALLGSFDAQKLTVDFGGPIAASDAWAYRVVGSIQDSRRYWSADAKLKGKVIAPMVSYRVSSNTELTLKLVAAEHWIYREPLLIIDSAVNAATKDPFLAPGLSAKGLNGIQPWSHVGTHSADIFAQLTTTLNENISLRFAANGRYYFEDSDQMFLSTPSLGNRYNPYSGTLTQDYTWAFYAPTNRYESTYAPFFNPHAIPVRGDIQASRRQTANVQTDAVARYLFDGVSSQTVAGFAYSRQTGYGRGHAGTLPAVDLDHLDASAYPVYSSSYSFYNGSAFTNLQAYLNQRLGFMDDRVLVTAGVLRYDTMTLGRNILAGAAPSILDAAKNSWNASLLLKPRENISVYYSHSTNSSPTIANNRPLWRDGVQDEIGFKTEFFNQRLAFNGAWFEIAQTNVTIPNPDHQTDPSAPEQLISDFGNHGFEFELIGRVTENLSALATYSDLKMRDSLGRYVRGVADNNAAVLLNYRFTDGTAKGLTLNFGVNYSGKRAGDTPPNFTPLGLIGRTSFFLKPYYATTLGASYRWADKYNVRLNIDNVFNQAGDIIVAGGRVSGTGITTAPGINFKLATTVEF